MRTVRILGSRPANHPFPIVSYLIRLIEWSPISHVGLNFGDVAFHAHFNEIEFVPIDQYLNQHKIIHEIVIPLTDIEYDNLRSLCSDLVGSQKGYWTTLLGVLIPQFLRNLFKIFIKHPFPKGYTCSWIILDVFNSGALNRGIDPAPVDPPNFTTRDVINAANEYINSNAKKI